MQDPQRLILEGLGVTLDLGRVEHRPGGRATARIPDPRRVVADDQDDQVAEVLELAQLAENDGMPEMDVRCRRIDAQLDPQRSPLARGARELFLERALGQRIDRVAS